jgi:hypothetical protein
MFRFTIRDMLWLTVVVAMGVGWWIDRQSIVRERMALAVEKHALKRQMIMRRIDSEIELMEHKRLNEQRAAKRAARQREDWFKPMFILPDPNRI